jgi:hypothetical protein
MGRTRAKAMSRLYLYAEPSNPPINKVDSLNVTARPAQAPIKPMPMTKLKRRTKQKP